MCKPVFVLSDCSEAEAVNLYTDAPFLIQSFQATDVPFRFFREDGYEVWDFKPGFIFTLYFSQN